MAWRASTPEPSHGGSVPWGWPVLGLPWSEVQARVCRRKRRGVVGATGFEPPTSRTPGQGWRWLRTATSSSRERQSEEQLISFDDLNDKPREFVIAALKELCEGDYGVDATLGTVHNTIRDEWYLHLAGRQVELAASVDAAILVELEDTKYIRLVRGAGHVREYSFSKKAHNEYKLYVEPTIDRGILSEQPDFSFITDPELRSIIQSDYKEIQRCVDAEAYKAATVMCGSVMEALLLDALSANEANARRSSHAPKGKAGKLIKVLGRWPLSSMIDVAEDLQIIPTTTIGFMSDAVREYRNLIHPAVQMRKQVTPEKQEANAARAALDLIIKNLA